MSKVDWSFAPEGATHFNKNNDMFYLFKDGGFYFYSADDLSIIFGGPPSDYEMTSFVERPKQPQAWSGPEDGLPPVGTVCEFAGGTECPEDPFDKDLKEGMKATIIAHFKCGDFTLAAFTFDPENPDRGMVQVEQASFGCFRKIKTPDQIASDARESAIRELMDIAQVDCRVTAARLVDAGFKREVV